MEKLAGSHVLNECAYRNDQFGKCYTHRLGSALIRLVNVQSGDVFSGYLGDKLVSDS